MFESKNNVSPCPKKIFFDLEDDQTPISQAFLNRNYAPACSLFKSLLELRPSKEEIFKALNHTNGKAKKELETISNAARNSPKGFEFVGLIENALGFRDFLTHIQNKTPDYMTQREWDEDDRREVQTLPPAATLTPVPALTPAFLPDNPNAIPTTPPTPAVIARHRTTPSKRSIKKAGKEAFGMKITRNQSLFWYAAQGIAEGKQRT